jgi:membrane protein involved in colicin uptake
VHVHTLAQILLIWTHMRTHADKQTYAQTHTHAHTHTHIQNTLSDSQVKFSSKQPAKAGTPAADPDAERRTADKAAENAKAAMGAKAAANAKAAEEASRVAAEKGKRITEPRQLSNAEFTLTRSGRAVGSSLGSRLGITWYL